MIKYNLNNINDWNFGEDNIIKVYRNNAVCYYKIDTSSPSGQTPCFAVVDNISQYSDTEFEDVFNKADNKWYKLNNLNQYEQYGVYGSSTATTYYDGKLTIDNGYEYQYSGNSWNNMGAVSGSSRVPQGYTEVEYIQNTSTAFINTGFKPNQNTDIYLTTQCVTSTSGGRQIGAGGYDGVNAIQYDYENGATGTLHISWGGHAGWITYNSCVGDFNKHTYAWLGSGTFVRDSGTSAEFTATASYGNYQCTDNLGIFTRYQNGSGGGSNECFRGKLFDFKMYDNGTLIRDLVPCKRDSDSKYGAYDVVNDVFYSSANSVALTGGSEYSPVIYPVYYDEIQDPPDNVTFSSMAEAESYECPWVGMKAKIDGDNYVFSGDSQGGYEWVYNPSRLPIGYTEVEYVENQNRSYLNTQFKANQDTRIVAKMQCVTSSQYGRYIGAGTYSSKNAMQFDYESNYNGTLHVSWGAQSSWSTYSSCVGDYNVHIYDWDKNYFYRDKGEPNEFSATTTYGTFQCTDNLGIFTFIQNGNPSAQYSTEYLFGRMYSFQIYDNGTLVRDLVPCIRDNDNTVGAYDIVNDVFYYPPNYASYPLVAGNPV